MWAEAWVRYLVIAGLAFLAGVFGKRALAGGRAASSASRVDDDEERRSASQNVLISGLRGRPGATPVSALGRIGRELGAALEGRDPDIVQALSDVMTAAYEVGASDVHISPDDRGAKITFRVDGMLYDVGRVPRSVHPRIVSRVKVVAKLSIYMRDQPQDGRLMLDFENGRTEVRVSTLPTSHGEKVVMRLHLASSEHYSLSRLGIGEEMLGEFHLLLRKTQGLLFLTGPTGSGKTTTIYSALRHIRESRGDLTNIVTIEDPIEFDLPEIAQTQVNAAAGLSFAEGLRSILRQDPDVIVVGEVRDRETTKIALQAGLSGHLIITSVHAESAAGVFTRLLNMDVEPFMLASASVGVLSQRLVRMNCSACAAPKAVTRNQARLLARLGQRSIVGEFAVGRGCDACLGKGLVGRTGLYELMVVDEAIREMVVTKAPTGRLHALAEERGMVTLLSDGMRQAAAGVIPLDEVLRVAT
jgi:type II secretory ATPase GspE/PulE/Tfp pilus assembly ATPase PilB-like protein